MVGIVSVGGLRQCHLFRTCYGQVGAECGVDSDVLGIQLTHRQIWVLYGVHRRMIRLYSDDADLMPSHRCLGNDCRRRTVPMTVLRSVHRSSYGAMGKSSSSRRSLTGLRSISA